MKSEEIIQRLLEEKHINAEEALILLSISNNDTNQPQTFNTIPWWLKHKMPPVTSTNNVSFNTMLWW